MTADLLPDWHAEVLTVPTLNSRHSPAELCRLNGWGPGTRLVGDEGFGPTTIEITAVGEKRILAKCLDHDGVARVTCRESSWALDCRAWHEVKP